MGDTFESSLLTKYSPHQETLHNRYYIYKLIKAAIYRALEKRLIKVTVYGSLPLRTFLTEGDIDITVITTPEDFDIPAYFLQKIKLQLIKELPITNTQEICAEVAILKFKVFDLSIDISINQIGGVRTLIFLEEICRLYPKHLLKKSIILCKAWGTHYSRVLGSMHGLLATYALEVLVVFIINTFPEVRTSPMQVFMMLIQYFSEFDWENNIVTCCGIIGCNITHQEFEMASQKGRRMQLGYEKIESLRKELRCPSTYWVNKFVNISDPMFPGNNLGKSISFATFPRIKFGFQVAGELLRKEGVEALFQHYHPQIAMIQTIKEEQERQANDLVPISFFANIRKLKEALFCCLAVMDPSFPQNY